MGNSARNLSHGWTALKQNRCLADSFVQDAMTNSFQKLLLFPALLLVVAALVVASANGAMRSERVQPKLCHTVGGGKFVEIPGFPGEMIDRRLLRDVERMVRKYKVMITDGYSLDPIHSANGEHPLGLAVDIVPNKAAGGRWKDVGRLARWAEPVQDQPRAPFRWVGYNGDLAHGRGHHLHLSWAHGKSKYGKPAREVYTTKCPKKGKQSKPPVEEPTDPTPGEPGGGSEPGEGGNTGSGGKGGKDDGGGTGGTGGTGGSGETDGSGSGKGTGGVGARMTASAADVESQAGSPRSVETSGADRP